MRRLTSAALVAVLGAAALAAPVGVAHANVTPLPLPSTDMSVTGFAPDRAAPGDQVTYRLTVTNLGPEAAAPYLDVLLPVGSTEPTYNHRPIESGSVRIDRIEPGEAKQISIRAKIGSADGGPVLGSKFEVSQGPYDAPVYQDTLSVNNFLNLNTVSETPTPDFGDHGRLHLTGRVTGEVDPGRLVRQRLVIHNTGRNRTGEVALVGVMSRSSGEIVKVTGIEGGRGVITKVGLNYTLPPLDAGTYRVVTIESIRSHAGEIGGSYFVGADSAGYPELELRG